MTVDQTEGEVQIYAIFCYDFVTSFKAQVWEIQINRITYMKFKKMYSHRCSVRGVKIKNIRYETCNFL